MERKCMDCGEPLVGRADKKFCDDACRANYNNRRNSGESGYLRKVNNILKRNRKILAKLSPEGGGKVKWKTLINDGFNFNRSEEHTSELQSLMRNSYAVYCLKKKKKTNEK